MEAAKTTEGNEDRKGTELVDSSTSAESIFFNTQAFDLALRAAKLLSSSSIVPVAYRSWDEKKSQENPNALPNCVVALNMAQRMKKDPLMVMQNLHIIEGRPSWSSPWIIACINETKRFTTLKFQLRDLGVQEVSYVATTWVDRKPEKSTKKETIKNVECIAYAIERSTGERIESPPVTMEMAVKEGWFSKTGSKWQTMPELMLRYRAASFFGRLNTPELLMGLPSVEEAEDIIDINPAPKKETQAKEHQVVPGHIKELPQYTDELLQKNINSFQKAINDGGASADIIAKLSSKFQLSDDHINKIQSMKKDEKQEITDFVSAMESAEKEI